MIIKATIVLVLGTIHIKFFNILACKDKNIKTYKKFLNKFPRNISAPILVKIGLKFQIKQLQKRKYFSTQFNYFISIITLTQQVRYFVFLQVLLFALFKTATYLTFLNSLTFYFDYHSFIIFYLGHFTLVQSFVF